MGTFQPVWPYKQSFLRPFPEEWGVQCAGHGGMLRLAGVAPEGPRSYQVVVFAWARSSCSLLEVLFNHHYPPNEEGN